MISIEATVPSLNPPNWAIWERKLLDIMLPAARLFLEKYTRPDGTLIWRESWDNSHQKRDGADDFYESFYNWPLLYLIGGDEQFLPLALRQWDAVTKQLTTLGPIYKEYERGYDQFHQSESYIYFYFLCLADPTNPKLIERARRFAGFYLNEDPEAINYDAQHKLIRAPHNGSAGPRWGNSDDTQPTYGWYPYMVPYGLPFYDVPGITSYEDCKDPQAAQRMGETMERRWGKGDTVVNLLVTSLITNAYLLTGDAKFSAWVTEYVDAWIERAASNQENGGLLPDNVGLSGIIGEYFDGKWYGGLYGWTFPHGYYCIGMAAVVAASNAFLMTGRKAYLDLPRSQMDYIVNIAQYIPIAGHKMSLEHHWIGQIEAADRPEDLFMIPYRFGDLGWFDYQPVSPIYQVAIWNISQDDGDWQRIMNLRRATRYDWRQVMSFRTKEDSGHEQPWICFLKGENPDYPELILRESYGQVCRRLEMIRQDEADLTTVNIHHWQQLNPVLTEALVQLTLGAPQIIYNGGLLLCSVRYFDAQSRRPGLPPDVAALVENVGPKHITIQIVNLSPFEIRRVLLQAGGFVEHQFEAVRYSQRSSGYPGAIDNYAAPTLKTNTLTVPIGDKYLEVRMPPATEIRLELILKRWVNQPSYALPWTDQQE